MRKFALAAGLTAWTAIVPLAAEEIPNASELLFDSHDWQSVPPGTTLRYKYERVSGLPSERMRGFSDTIRLLVTSGSSTHTRNVQVEMFSGPQRQPAGPFDDVSGNPVLLLFLEHHLQTLQAALGANPRYLKNAIRAGLREKASISAVTVTFQGKSIPAWQIETRPFVEDSHRSRMMGLDSMRYSFMTSDQVPGQILSIDTFAVAADGHTLLQEILNYEAGGD